MPRRPSGAALRRRLVEELERKGNLTDPAVRKAFLAVPRERFLPPGMALDEVYANRAIVTRRDANNAATSSSSQPSIMALMLERLDLAPGLNVLEIGAGTGYNAALLSTIVGPGGSVTSVELEPEVAGAAAAALRSGSYSAEVVTGDGRRGWPPGAPYDRIVLTASAEAVSRAWFDQLVPDGLVQLPLQIQGPDLQAVVTLRKDEAGFRSVDAVDGGFMVLRGHDATVAPPQHAPSISIGEHVDGQHASFGSLAGVGLRRLSPAARRRLAAVMLERPRVRRIPGALQAGRSPWMWLQLARPGGAVVARYLRSGLMKGGGWAAAVATLDGRSLAVAVFGRGRGIRLEAYGGAGADDALERLLATWRAEGRPGTRDLDVRATFPDDGDGPARLRIGWRQPSTVSSRK